MIVSHAVVLGEPLITLLDSPKNAILPLSNNQKLLPKESSSPITPTTEPQSAHWIHSAIGSRMNRILFRSSLDRNKFQEHNYRLFRVLPFPNSPKRNNALLNHPV